MADPRWRGNLAESAFARRFGPNGFISWVPQTQIGYLVSQVGDWPYNAAKSSQVWRTDDGGENWRIVEGFPVELGIVALIAPTPDNLLVKLHNGELRHSHDGGRTWRLTLAAWVDPYNVVKCEPGGNGLVETNIGWFRLTDYGEKVEKIVSPSFPPPVYNDSEYSGFWELMTPDSPDSWNLLYINRAGRGLAIRPAMVAATYDYGQSWREVKLIERQGNTVKQLAFSVLWFRGLEMEGPTALIDNGIVFDGQFPTPDVWIIDLNPVEDVTLP